MKAAVRTILVELRSHLEALYRDRLVGLVLYGSHARGDADPGSDIDVLVVLKGPVDSDAEGVRTGELIAALSLAHNVVLSCLFMEEERFLHRQGPLLRNIRREGVSV
jgi:predicted nucleotidyltransferase